MDHYDVIIVGTGAGGGTLARSLAPTGKRILLPGLYEDIGGLAISPGDTFCGSVEVRDQLQEAGAQGSFVVWLVGGNSNESGIADFSNLGNGPNWSQVSACVTATSAHTQVRIQFYPTPGTPTLDVDAVDVHHALQVAAPLTQNGSFESGPAPWLVGSGSNYALCQRAISVQRRCLRRHPLRRHEHLGPRWRVLPGHDRAVRQPRRHRVRERKGA